MLLSDSMALSETENGCVGGEQGDLDAILKAPVLRGFSHSDEIKALISSLPEVHGEMLTSEQTTEKFRGKTVIRWFESVNV